MIAYWLLFAMFAIGVLASQPDPYVRHRNAALLGVALGITALMIGLRYGVGGDWNAYEFLFGYAQRNDLGRMLGIGDPGFQLVNWLASRSGAGSWLTNLICGAIFSWGLFRLARLQPDPWLAALVAVPYLIIVVAMGYTRQSVAIGVLMAGIASLERGGSMLRFVGYVLVATTFHKTAMVVLPLAIFAAPRNRLMTLLGGASVLFVLYNLFLADAMQSFLTHYVRAGYQSQGAAIRVLMSAIPAVLFLAKQRQFGFAERERKFWRNVAWTTLAMLFALPFAASSTVIDRLALYMLPIQMVVFSRVALVYRMHSLLRSGILIYSALVLFVWLNFAVHASSWVPYNFTIPGFENEH